jgi:hypothetical protein
MIVGRRHFLPLNQSAMISASTHTGRDEQAARLSRIDKTPP